MDLTGVADVSARVSVIEQRLQFSSPFASVLEQVSQARGSGSIMPAPTTGSTPVTGQASPGADSLAGYLFGERLGSSTGTTAEGDAGGGIQAAAGSDWAGALPEAGRKWTGAIQNAAAGAGIDPRLLAAVTWAESGFNPKALSGAGAIGMTQLMPATAAGLGVDATDPAANLTGGARYLAGQLKSFGRPDLAIAAYNAGPNAVRRAGAVPNYPETQAYVKRVLGYYRQLGGVV